MMKVPYLPIVLRLLCSFFLIAMASSTPASAAGQNDDVLGVWDLTRVLDSSNIASIDDKQAAKLIGKSLVVRTDKVTLAGESCPAPDFHRHYEDTVRYLREEAHAASGRLGLPEVVTVVDLACTEILIKGHNKGVLYWKGFFFEVARQPSANG